MTEPLQKKESTSGTVTIDENKIIWMSQGEIISTIELTEILVIGEYTTDAGPWFDDWFLIFVKKDSSYLQIPFYIDGRESLINFLQSKLKPTPGFGALVGSTKWATVDYPDEFKSQPLFRLSPTDKYYPPKTWFAKLLYGLGLGRYSTKQEIVFSEPVENYIKTASR
jgi:hypothetical protein